MSDPSDAVLVTMPHSHYAEKARWAYAEFLPQRRALRTMMARGVPRWEALLLPLLVPALVPLLRRAFRITPESAERSRLRVSEVFDEVGARLGDGRRYLVGGRFTAADLSFAALASPVLLPPACGASYPALETVPAAMRDEVLRLRAAVAGRFALRLYAEERQHIPAGVETAGLDHRGVESQETA